MRKLCSIFCCILFITSGFSQKKLKVKGNKIVVSEQHAVNAFTTLDVSDNFEVILSESIDPMLEIEADSNLHEFISFEVKDSIFSITTTRDIRRSKKLTLKIKYPETLRNLIIRDKANIKAIGPIAIPNLAIEANDYSKIFATVETDNLKFVANGKSDNELHITAANAKIQLNDNTEFKGILTTEQTLIDLYSKTTAKIEGKIASLELRAEGDTNFYGERAIINNASIQTEGSTDVYIMAKETITINAIEKSEIYILGQPKISITNFDNESILYKKEEGYTPGFFN
ncbi:GIN domain-containing protein [Aquimarina rhabdastrellae]